MLQMNYSKTQIYNQCLKYGGLTFHHPNALWPRLSSRQGLGVKCKGVQSRMDLGYISVRVNCVFEYM